MRLRPTAAKEQPGSGDTLGAEVSGPADRQVLRTLLTLAPPVFSQHTLCQARNVAGLRIHSQRTTEVNLDVRGFVFYRRGLYCKPKLARKVFFVNASGRGSLEYPKSIDVTFVGTAHEHGECLLTIDLL
jgi:hypothetical protein